MALTKSRTSIWSSQTLTAGAGSIQSSWQQIDDSYSTQISIYLQNGATGPTIAAQVQIEVANDYNGGSPTLAVNYGGALIGSTSNAGFATWSIELPVGIAAFRLVAGSNTGQNVTVNADYSKVTAV